MPRGKKTAAPEQQPSEATPEFDAETPAAADNGPDAQEKRKYLEEYRNHRRLLADLMKDAADERGNGRSILKSFENKGGNPKMLRRMWELTDLTQSEAENEVREYLGYAIDVGVRVSFDAAGQGSLADVLDRKPTVEAQERLSQTRAYDQGRERAMAGGQVAENPKKAGTAAHQQWHKGFSDYVWERDGAGNANRESATVQ